MNSDYILIICLYFLCLMDKKFLQQDLDCLFKNCSCTKAPTSNKDNIVVNIYCDGKSSNIFPLRSNPNAEYFKIHTLQITNFKLDSLSDNVFNKLSIESLDLRKNSLNSLSINTFNGISGLQVLDLSGNELTQIYGNEMLRHLENLTAFSLASNKITQLPNDLLSNMNALKTLDLSNNLLTSIDKNLLEPVKNTLQSLYLAGNKLENLPSLKNLNQLNYFDYSDNLVKTLVSVELPDSLTGLIGSNNLLEKLTIENVRNLKNLLILDLSNNLISIIDKATFNFNTQLNVLRLGGNKISVLPNILTLVNLAELDLSNQKLTNLKKITNYALDRMGSEGKKNYFSSLVRLDLSKNSLESLDEKAFCSHYGSYAIEYIDLSLNPIKSFDPCIFTGLGKMTLVWYSNNSTTPSPVNNCNCDIVNYLSGYKVKLISDCDISDSTKCTRIPSLNNTMCSDKAKYTCDSRRINSSIKLISILVVFSLAIF